jgi:hypothetical protein
VATGIISNVIAGSVYPATPYPVVTPYPAYPVVPAPVPYPPPPGY